MPGTRKQQKMDRDRGVGGDTIGSRLLGDYFDDTLEAAQAYCDEVGGCFLSPFDNLDVIEGQASVAVEMAAQLGRAPDMVVLPVGGGGLSAGVTRYLDEVSPKTEIRYVEPAGGKSLKAALREKHPVKLQKVDSFVDGAAVAQIGAYPFEILAHTDPDRVLDAPEDRICTTILEMLNVEGIVLEPAGALSVNALVDLRGEIVGKTVVCVTSGGNFDFERLPEVKERAQRYSGVKKYFILRLPQRPGARKTTGSACSPWIPAAPSPGGPCSAIESACSATAATSRSSFVPWPAGVPWAACRLRSTTRRICSAKRLRSSKGLPASIF